MNQPTTETQPIIERVIDTYINLNSFEDLMTIILKNYPNDLTTWADENYDSLY
jgi:hypothetical protein